MINKILYIIAFSLALQSKALTIHDVQEDEDFIERNHFSVMCTYGRICYQQADKV